jgi:uncharacterized protein with HEPN domain
VKDDRLYLIHITECIARIEEYTAGGSDAFFGDRKTQDAVVRNLQTLAESTTRLSEAVKLSRPDVDWRAIAGFRNVAVHDYLGIDAKRIWHIVEHDLPDLKSKIAAVLASLQIRSSE